MQFEHLRYTELNLVKKLGHDEENDDAWVEIDEKRESHEKHRSDLKEELDMLMREKVLNLERKA